MACLYRRKKQFWISYYQGGKQVQKSLNTSDGRIARTKKRRIEYELSLGDLYVASKLRITMVLEDFCKHLKTTRTYKSAKNELSRLRSFFGPVCESLKMGHPDRGADSKRKRPWKDKYANSHIKAEFLEDISTEVINHFIADRIELNSWSPKTANLMRQILHRFFAYAIKHHGFRSRDRRYPNPVTTVDKYPEPAPVIRFLSLKEIEKQLDVLRPYPVIHALTATFIYAGLRREEGLWLTRTDVNLDKRLIQVQAKTVDKEFWQPKTKRNRVVPISGNLYEILSSYEPPHNCVWFFPSPQGRRWHPDNFSQDLRYINNKVGLEWSCLHFRHTFGSHLAIKGESLYKISKLMGNSPEICRKHYAALIPEEMADVVEFSLVKEDRLKDGETKELLKKILSELRGEEEPERKVPNLKLVRFDNPA